MFLPPQMRRLANHAKVIQAPGATLGEVINNADQAHPGVKNFLLPDGATLKPGWTAICGAAPARYGLRERVAPDAEIHFVPSIAGG